MQFRIYSKQQQKYYGDTGKVICLGGEWYPLDSQHVKVFSDRAELNQVFTRLKAEGELIEIEALSHAECPYRISPKPTMRPVNGLNIEISSPCNRCRIKVPSHWQNDPHGSRWLGSGGDPLVLGQCTPANCPLIAHELTGNSLTNP